MINISRDINVDDGRYLVLWRNKYIIFGGKNATNFLLLWEPHILNKMSSNNLCIYTGYLYIFIIVNILTSVTDVSIIERILI